MVFSTLNVDLNVASKWPVHEGIKVGYPQKSLFYRYPLCQIGYAPWRVQMKRYIDTSLHKHSVECQLLRSFSYDFVRSGPSNMHRCRSFPFALAGLSCFFL